MTSRIERLIERIRDSVVGSDTAIEGPWGLRRVTYCDYTASGRALSFVEDFLRDEVLPLYANTHSESSGTGLQTTRFREDARRIVARSVGAEPDDLVIFCGSGATAAVNKLIDVLELRLPAGLDERYGLSGHIPAAERPVVFVGPYEHHSNEVPWRETIAEVVTIDEDADGHVDLEHLQRELERTSGRPLRIGSFSAASNVTGIQTDSAAVTRLLHRQGALSFWDYAAAGPYVPIEMNPPDALERRDIAELGRLVDRNFDLRCKWFPVARRDRDMVGLARSHAASAKQCGSGGACLVLLRDDTRIADLEAGYRAAGFESFRPTLEDSG